MPYGFVCPLISGWKTVKIDVVHIRRVEDADGVMLVSCNAISALVIEFCG